MPVPTSDAIKILDDQIKKDRDKHESTTELKLFRDYAKGIHPLVLSTLQKKYLAHILGRKFADNVSHQIIAEARDRVTFNVFQCNDEPVSKYLSQWLLRTRFLARQGQVIYETFRDGNHAIGLQWNKDRERVDMYRQSWWDGEEGLFIAYDDLDEVSYAVREWKTDSQNGKRRTVWFPDRIERYMSVDGGATWDILRLDGDLWPFPMLDKDQTPLGVPWVHLVNAGRMDGLYGMSELDGGVTGFQDQINALQYDMTLAGRLTAFQMLWAAGVEVEEETDAVTGEKKPKEIEVGPGKVLTSDDPEAKFGHFPAGDISQLISLYERKLKSLSRMTRTPLHSITGGDWPSGEALVHAEQPAIGKAQDNIARMRMDFSQIGYLSCRLYNRFGKGSLNLNPETATITADFLDPERRDSLTRSVIINNLGNALSVKQKLREMGYDDETVERIFNELQEEADMAVDRQAAMVDRGIIAPKPKTTERGPEAGKGAPSSGAPRGGGSK